MNNQYHLNKHPRCHKSRVYYYNKTIFSVNYKRKDWKDLKEKLRRWKNVTDLTGNMTTYHSYYL